MRSLTRIAALAALAIVLVAATASKPTTLSADKVGDEVVVFGRLELPVGESVTITGRKKATGPLQDLFLVETVNGKAARPDTIVGVRGITPWPEGTAATLKGCEVGTLRFLHLEETNYGPGDTRWKGPHQVLFLSFVPSEVIGPAGLRLEKEK